MGASWRPPLEPPIIKKSKQFNQSNIASDIAELTLTPNVNGTLGYLQPIHYQSDHAARYFFSLTFNYVLTS